MKASVTGTVRKLVMLFGAEKAAEFLLICGGQDIYVLKDGEPLHEDTRETMELLGDECFGKLKELFGGTWFTVPLGQKFLIRYLRTEGLSQKKIAAKVRATQSGVYLILNDGIIDRSIHQDGRAKNMLSVEMILLDERDHQEEPAE